MCSTPHNDPTDTTSPTQRVSVQTPSRPNPETKVITGYVEQSRALYDHLETVIAQFQARCEPLIVEVRAGCLDRGTSIAPAQH